MITDLNDFIKYVKQLLQYVTENNSKKKNVSKYFYFNSNFINGISE